MMWGAGFAAAASWVKARLDPGRWAGAHSPARSCDALLCVPLARTPWGHRGRRGEPCQDRGRWAGVAGRTGEACVEKEMTSPRLECEQFTGTLGRRGECWAGRLGAPGSHL